MSFNTWTPHAVSSEQFHWRGKAWRMVEAQQYAATMKIVDTRDEQNLLEVLLEQSKPKLSDHFHGLHYLMATPFRYEPLRHGSWFRGVDDHGVFYCAQTAMTAGIELGYWRWRFLNDSEDLDEIEPVPHSAFSVELSSQGIDLRKEPFLQQQLLWRNPSDYTLTQQFANSVRKTDIGIILYDSVRDPEPNWCAAVLSPRAFAVPRPVGQMQTWFMKVTQEHLTLRSEKESVQISTEQWQ